MKKTLSIWEEKLKPENWNWTWILGILLFLLCINLFGPKGLLHLVLLEQQTTRLQDEIVLVEANIATTQKEIRAFENNPSFQQHVLRDRMGYLRSNEYRVEFVSPESQP